MPDQTPPQEPATPDLDALIQAARVEAATKGDGGSVGAVVARLATSGGSAAVAALQAEGFPRDALAAAVTVDSADKRIKARARLGIVAGEPMLWLTTTGWQAAGKTSGKERPPSAESATHAAAPGQIHTWLQQATKPWPGIRVSVVTGAPCGVFSGRVKDLAWASIQGGGGRVQGAGALVGGLVPDALVVERWPDAATYESAWGAAPASEDDVAEQTLALEVEDSRKGDEPLRWKVDRWGAALALGAVHRVIWVVRTSDVRDRLVALGVGTARQPSQLLVVGSRIGLPASALVAPIGADWWPVRLWQHQQQAVFGR